MATKLVKCKVCEEDAAKYKCPRCSIQTCSLRCCKQHKEGSGCNGQRDKTAFVPVKGFTDMNLLSDYRLLEDVDRSLWQYRRNKIVNRKNRTHFQIRLMKEAHHRGIKLRLLPDGFKKRKINSTLYVFSQKAIRWHIELQFPKVKQEASLIKVHENSLLGEELKTYLNSQTTSHLLWKDYRDNFDELTLLVEAEKTNSGQNLYRRVDPSKSISDNLNGHVVVEFPTIHVVTKDELDRYKVMGKETLGRSGEESNTTGSESESDEPPCKRQKRVGEDCRDGDNKNTPCTSEADKLISPVEINVMKDNVLEERCQRGEHYQADISTDEEPVCKRPKNGKEQCRDVDDERKEENASLDSMEKEVSQNSDNGHASVDVMEIKTLETVSIDEKEVLEDNGIEVPSQS